MIVTVVGSTAGKEVGLERKYVSRIIKNVGWN
jgi:hypothetical protein